MKKLNKIIVIDDDAIMNLISRRLFEQISIAEEVCVFSDSLEGLDYLMNRYTFEAAHDRQLGNDLVLLDLDMPGLGGFEILKKLKISAQLGRVVLDSLHVALITSHKDEKEAAKARQHGIECLLEKPLRISDIEMILAGIDNEMMHGY